MCLKTESSRWSVSPADKYRSVQQMKPSSIIGIQLWSLNSYLTVSPLIYITPIIMTLSCQSKEVEVERFGFFEKSFSASGEYANPYTDLETIIPQSSIPERLSTNPSINVPTNVSTLSTPCYSARPVGVMLVAIRFSILTPRTSIQRTGRKLMYACSKRRI